MTVNRASELYKQFQDVIGCLSETEGNLRFGRGAVSISDIAQQHYCEKALELRYLYPSEPTEIMTHGKQGHENVTALAMSVSTEKAIEEALMERDEPICIYEFRVAWEWKKLTVIGKADEVWFKGGNVNLVVERKFSNTIFPHSDYRVQTQLYCLGLEEMGFDILNAKYKIMVFKRTCFDCPKLTFRSCPIFSHDESHFYCDEGEVKAFTHPFDRKLIIKDLDWALDYWLEKREAIPTKKPAKCRACRQKSFCEHSLAKES